MNVRGWFAVALCACAAQAAAIGMRADVTIVDRSDGRVLPVYLHHGRCYVAGRPGAEYQINVRNATGADVLAVISVDGVNAISGETAHWLQSGYLLPASGSVAVRGWRKSLARVAAFTFAPIEDSYAARTGRPDDVGVIGVALFRAREPALGIRRAPGPWPDSSAPRSQGDGAHSREGSAEPPAPARADAPARDAPGAEARAYSPPYAPSVAPSVPAQPDGGKLGTGHGRSERSDARYVRFERASDTPDEVIAIYYDSYRNLVARGVIRAETPRIATPFPGRFVPDPR